MARHVGEIVVRRARAGQKAPANAGGSTPQFFASYNGTELPITAGEAMDLREAGADDDSTTIGI